MTVSQLIYKLTQHKPDEEVVVHVNIDGEVTAHAVGIDCVWKECPVIEVMIPQPVTKVKTSEYQYQG